MKMKTLAVAFGAFASLGSGAVWAAASSSASLSDFTIELHDLDPTDGIAPSIVFSPYNNGDGVTSVVWGSAYGYAYPDFDDHDTKFGGGAPFANLSQFVGNERANASSSIQGDNVAPGAQRLASSGYTAGGASGYTAGASTTPTYVQFSLTANTSVVFSAKADLSVTTTAGFVRAGYFDEATASYAISVIGPAPSGVGGQQLWREEELRSDAAAGSKSSFAMVSIEYLNPSDVAVGGLLRAQTGVSGYSNIARSAVPEPGTLFTMATGLVLLGGLRARRRACPPL